MSFLDDFNRRAKDAAAAASEKAKEVADSAKISAAILVEKRELDKNYRAIGQWYVCEHKDNPPAAIADIVAAVCHSQERIAQLQAQRDDDDDAPHGKVCPVCGNICEERFCPKCGAPMGD